MTRSASRPVPGRRLVRLYPAAWRKRHEDEMLALLEQRRASLRDRIDLLRGALDAHLHPASSSAVPARASLLGGGTWTVGSVAVAGARVAPDWPGYLEEMLPVAFLAVCCLLVAVVGCWLRIGDARDALDRLSVAVAVGGHLVWAAALFWATAGLGYGAVTALASTLAGLGTVLVGLALVRAGDWPIGGLVLVAPLALLIPSGATFLAFGAAWTLVGVLQLQGRERFTDAGPRGSGGTIA